MASKFVPVTGLEQAVALREAGLLYFRNHRGGWEHLPERSKFPQSVLSLGTKHMYDYYAYVSEE